MPTIISFNLIDCYFRKMRLLLFILFNLIITSANAQDNYEIQVYGSESVGKGRTMVELHSNFNFKGTNLLENGEYSSEHTFHETIEITHGITRCFELGLYLFNSIGDKNRTGFVGSHLRPRITAPEKWKLPVGLSLSFEFGFQKAEYSANTATLEMRPIIDKKWKAFYISFNPVLEKSFKGPDESNGLDFSPNIKACYDINKKIALGLEYYGGMGRVLELSALKDGQHQLFVITDIDFGEKWEFNAGFGYGLTESTEKASFKLILGHKF